MNLTDKLSDVVPWVKSEANPKQKVIPTHMSYLQDELDSFDKTLSLLEEKLNPVLSPKLDDAPITHASDPVPVVPFAASVQEKAWALKQLRARVEALSKRIEI